MTSSKSSSWCRRAAVVLILLVGMAGVASAGRKRLVVLDFEGDKAEKIQKDFVKLLRKSHTVITSKKWSSAAAELRATKVTDSNVKKVARKLKIDGVISGSVEKRRSEYIIRIKLRSGSSGDLVGSQVTVKSGGAKIDKSAEGDLKDELFEVIGDLESNRGGRDDDEEEEEEEDEPRKGFSKRSLRDSEEDEEEEEEERKPKKLSRKQLAAETKRLAREEAEEKRLAKKAADEERASKKKADDDERASKKKLARKSADDEEEEEEEEEEEDDNPLPKKKVASRDDDEDEESIEEDVEVGRQSSTLTDSPGRRAVDAAVGLSFTMRRMGFKFDPNRAEKPPGYKGLPVAGAVLDVTVYPLAIGHKSKGMLTNLGVTALYDKVLLISSEAPGGMKLETEQARYAFGVVFRYPLGKTATAPVVGVSLRYGRQNFTIRGDAGIPNVNYTIVDPQLFFKYPLSTKMALNASFGYMAILNTGGIQKADEYGAATVSGFEGEISGDYMLTKNGIFARAGLKFETIGFKFKGTGTKAMDGAVPGARDTYIGLALTAGYVF